MDKLIGINLIIDTIWLFLIIRRIPKVEAKGKNVDGSTVTIAWILTTMLTLMMSTGIYLFIR